MIPCAAAARTIAWSDQFAQGPRNLSAPTPVVSAEGSQQSDCIALLCDAILAPPWLSTSALRRPATESIPPALLCSIENP